jgi:hypothetical protein
MVEPILSRSGERITELDRKHNLDESLIRRATYQRGR